MCDSEQYFGGIPPAGIMLNARNFSATYYTSREVCGVPESEFQATVMVVLTKGLFVSRRPDADGLVDLEVTVNLMSSGVVIAFVALIPWACLMPS